MLGGCWGSLRRLCRRPQFTYCPLDSPLAGCPFSVSALLLTAVVFAQFDRPGHVLRNLIFHPLSKFLLKCSDCSESHRHNPPDGLSKPGPKNPKDADYVLDYSGKQDISRRQGTAQTRVTNSPGRAARLWPRPQEGIASPKLNSRKQATALIHLMMSATAMFHQLFVSVSWTGPKDQRTKVSRLLAPLSTGV